MVSNLTIRIFEFMKTKLCSIIIPALLLAITLHGQPSEKSSEMSFFVRGKVADGKTNELLEYVNVVLYKAVDSSLVTGTITSVAGEFEIITKRPGRYYLTADFIGFEKTIVSDIHLRPGQNIFNAGELKLNPSLVGINEIEVVAERPFVTYHLDKKVVDVSLNPSAQGGTAVDALENVPSIQTDIEGNVTLRGSSSFTVLIDGRQSPLSGTDALNQIPASAIDKIEIITNPSVKYDPDGTTGIINIISKKGKLLGHSLVVNTSFGASPITPKYVPQYISNKNDISPSYSADLLYSYRKEKITFTGGASIRNHKRLFYNTSDQYINKVDTVTGEIESVINLYKYSEGDRQFGGITLKGGIDYELFEGNVANIMFSYNEFSFQRGSETYISNYNNTPYQQNRISSDGFKTKPTNFQINIGDKHVFNTNLDHYFSVDAMYRTSSGSQNNSVESSIANLDWNSVNQDTVDQRSFIAENGYNIRVELDYMQPVGESFIIEAGYTLRIDQEEQDYNYLTRDFNADDWFQMSEQDDESIYNRSINAGWALFKGQVLGLNLSGGLRLEHTDRHVETGKDNYEFNYDSMGYYPSFAISKEFNNGDVIQASYSKRVDRPRPWHLNPFPRLSDGYTQYLPNPELTPEYTSSYEVNFQKSLGGISFLSLETFYHKTDNAMERLDLFVSDTLSVYTRRNIGKEMRLGVEFGGHVKMAKWFSFQPSVSTYYYEAEGVIYDEFKKVSDVAIDGRLTTNFILPSKTRIQIMGFYRGAEVEISEEQKEMYWLSGAVRQEFLNRKLSLTFRVDDIFSTRKRIDTGYSENWVVYSEGIRKSPTFVLSLSYRLNQAEKRNGEYNEKSDGGNGSGGMDMEF